MVSSHYDFTAMFRIASYMFDSITQYLKEHFRKQETYFKFKNEMLSNYDVVCEMTLEAHETTLLQNARGGDPMTRGGDP